MRVLKYIQYKKICKPQGQFLGSIWTCKTFSGLLHKVFHFEQPTALIHLYSKFSVSETQANAGDSRAIAGVNGQYEALSFDHKPNNEEEMRRITAAGGWVESNRVNGNLALSRALGDFIFKTNETKRSEEQVVTGEFFFLVLKLIPILLQKIMIFELF